MKKLLLMLVMILTCCMLAGCGDNADKTAEKEDNYYDDFICVRNDDDYYSVRGEAYMKDVLLLAEVQAEAETELNFEFEFESASGDIRLFCVQADGTESQIGGSETVGITGSPNLTISATVPEGESRLEWRTSGGGTMEFKVNITNIAGVEFVTLMDKEMEDL